MAVSRPHIRRLVNEAPDELSERNRNVRCFAEIEMSAVSLLSVDVFALLLPEMLLAWTVRLLLAIFVAAVGRIGLRMSATRAPASGLYVSRPGLLGGRAFLRA